VNGKASFFVFRNIKGNRNKSVYFFESLCKDEPDLPLGDCRYTIGTGKDSDSAFVRILDDYVVGINGSEDWRHGFMKYELNLIERYKEGESKGLSAEKISQYASIPVEKVQSIFFNLFKLILVKVL